MIVNFDFELFDQYGQSLGNCSEWVQSWNTIRSVLGDLLRDGRETEAAYIQDALNEWGESKEAEMGEVQYDFVKSTFLDMHVDILKQILARFPIIDG